MSSLSGLGSLRICLLQALVSVLSYCRKEPMECAGALCGAVGSLLLAQNSDYSKFGWIAFLMSNIFLIATAKKKEMHGLLCVQLYFIYTSISGLVNYF